MQSSGPEFADPDSKLFNSIILARPLPDDATVTTLKDLFPGAIEIAFPRQALGARYAMNLSSLPSFVDLFHSVGAFPLILLTELFYICCCFAFFCSINQSKQIYTAPCVASESEARDGRD